MKKRKEKLSWRELLDLMDVHRDTYKRVRGAPSSLASLSIRILLADEVDRFPASTGTEGDPLTLAEKRTTIFWNRKKMLWDALKKGSMSHPAVAPPRKRRVLSAGIS
jgi:hypothetical protein